jgi:lipopolysaccharide export system protein LptC
MTAQADLIRDRRRHFAAPGGSHDRLVHFLARALPAGIGTMMAVMLLAPLSQRGEISFLLDRNAVATVGERLHVERAMYRGTDNEGRDFAITAGNAVQRSATVPVVTLDELIAEIELREGPARLNASQGQYDFASEQVAVAGPVEFSAADGYRMVTNDVAIDLKQKRLTGSGGISGAVPTGTFSANRIIADLDARTVVLEGNARLRMTPGKLRIPQ